MRSVYLNGKFTAQRTTGVQRSAACLVGALDAQLAVGTQAAACRWVLLCPPQSVLPVLRRIECRRVGPALGSLHLWEQLRLPLAARDGLLVSLAGSAPLLARRQACTFHDAAVFDRPDAYTAAFGAWYRFAFRRLARSAALVLTVSAFSKVRLVEVLRLAPHRLAVVANGAEHLAPLSADASVLAKLGLERERYLLAVGSANPTKNFAALLRSFHALAAPGAVRLVIVGEGRRGVFAPAALEGPPDPRIVICGAVRDTELKALYENALGLVFPSTYEGFGLPPLEAMACGCAVAASNAAAVPEVCGDAALYFDPHAPAAIAAAMQRLIDEPALRERLRQSGRARAAAFDWAAAAAALLGALSERGLVDAPVAVPPETAAAL